MNLTLFDETEVQQQQCLVGISISNPCLMQVLALAIAAYPLAIQLIF